MLRRRIFGSDIMINMANIQLGADIKHICYENTRNRPLHLNASENGGQSSASFPSKIKHFVWRAYNECIPTYVNLSRCHMDIDNIFVQFVPRVRKQRIMHYSDSQGLKGFGDKYIIILILMILVVIQFKTGY